MQDRSASVAEEAALEQEIASPGDAAALATVIFANAVDDARGAGAMERGGQDHSILRMMVAMDPRQSLRPGIAVQYDPRASGLPAAAPAASANPKAFQIAVQLKVADLDAARAFLDVDEGDVRDRLVGFGELFDVREWLARTRLETAVAKSARAPKRCTPAFDPDRSAATCQVDDVRRSERVRDDGAVAASGRVLLANDIGRRPENDRSAAGSVEMRRHRREGARIVGPPVAFRAEHFGGNLSERSSPYRSCQSHRSRGDDELTSRRYHRWTFSRSV